jgi:hypothetical protein
MKERSFQTTCSRKPIGYAAMHEAQVEEGKR